MKKINVKVAAGVVTASLVFGSVAAPMAVVLAQGINTKEAVTNALANGNYTVNVKVLNETTDSPSMAARYFTTTKAKLQIKDGAAKLQLRYSDSMIGGLAQVSEGSKQELKVTEDGTEKYIELAFTSINDTAVLYMEIDTKTAYGVMKHNVRVQLEEDSIEKDGVDGPTTPDVTASPTVVPTTAPTVPPTTSVPTQSPSNENSVKDGAYEVEVYLWNATSDKASMAASALENKATLIVKNGVGTMVVNTKQMSMMGITAYLQELKVQSADGSYVNAIVGGKDENGNPTSFAFKLPSFNEYINVKVNPHLQMLGNADIDARLKIDYSTLKGTGAEVTPDATSSPSVKPTTPPSTATPAPTNKPTNTPTTDVMKDGVYEANVYLWHASNNTASMAASALNNTARIEVKNGTGTIYIYTKQMTFGTITAYLQELKVQQVNGSYSNAKIQKKDANGNPTCFSFTLPNFLEYVTIKVNPHVAMMGNMDIDARLKIDYSSLKEVKEDNLTAAPSETPSPTKKPSVQGAKPEAPSIGTPAPTKAPTILGTGNNGTTTETSTESEDNDTEQMKEETEVPETSPENQEMNGEEAPAATEMPTATEAPEAPKKSKKSNAPLVAAAALSSAGLLGSAGFVLRARFLKK